MMRKKKKTRAHHTHRSARRSAEIRKSREISKNRPEEDKAVVLDVQVEQAPSQEEGPIDQGGEGNRQADETAELRGIEPL